MEGYIERPVTTLFLLTSVDGKISSGVPDDYDFEIDLPRFLGNSEGLRQYYELEQQTDLWSLTTGKVKAKCFNLFPEKEQQLPVAQVIVDSNHITPPILQRLAREYRAVVVATNNRRHCAYQCRLNNVIPIEYISNSFTDLLNQLSRDFDCKRLTVQSGGLLNQSLFDQHLIDYIDLVVAPVMVGGSDVPGIIGGQSLSEIGIPTMYPLVLQSVTPLKCSYLYLKYRVIHN